MTPLRSTFVISLAVLVAGAGSVPPAPKYERIFTLNPKEGVFAYARISPDGKRLAYASQIATRPLSERPWTITAVDLATKKELFSATGIDAYWSNEGSRLIYSGSSGVTVRDVDKNTIGVYPEASGLGDYYSWATRDGKDLIMTIESNYYWLTADGPTLPHTSVKTCPVVGKGERPLISHDGKRISTFNKGILLVRGLDHCDDMLDTHIQGSKADFSWDGRYIAFHSVKKEGAGYQIQIVDLKDRTVRTMPNLEGSAFFPSWTRDGRLCFRYDGPDYRGFMMASGVLDVSAQPLPTTSQALPERREWNDVFPETTAPRGLSMVLIWAPWSAHSLQAFSEMQSARDELSRRGVNVAFSAAADPGSRESDITGQIDEFGVTIPRIPLSQKGLAMTEARNQMPTTLLFRDGVLVDRRLGAQSAEQLREMVLRAR